MSASTVYLIAWDNGLNASGVFPYEFDTEAEAQTFGENWSAEMNATEPDYNGYSFEVITSKPAPEPKPAHSEIWTACIQKSIVGPIISHVRQRKHKQTEAMPQHVSEFLVSEGRKLAISNEELDALEPTAHEGFYRASDGDVLKVSRKFHGLRVWITFKIGGAQ